MNEYNAKYIGVGKPSLSGSVWKAPIGTPLPTDAVTPLNEAFVSMGYSGEDGLVNASNRESETLKAWGGQTVATPQTSVEDQYTVTLIETLRSDVLKAVYGDNSVTGTDLETGIAVAVGMEEPQAASWVFDMIINGALKRVVLPNAKVSELGDITYKDDELVGFETTINALPDENAKTHYEYMIENQQESE